MIHPIHDKRIDALLALASDQGGGGGPPGITTSLVWKPGGVAAGNVYTTWTTLYAAILALGSTYYTIGVDTSLGAAIVPAGAYSLGSGLWTSSGGFSAMSFAAGATIQATAITLYSIEWSGSDVWDVTAGISVFIISDGAELDNSGAGQFFRVHNTAIAGQVLLRGAFVGPSGGGIFRVDAGANGQVLATENTTIFATALVSGFAGTLQYTADVGVPFPAPAGWTYVRTTTAAEAKPSIGATGARPVGAAVTDGQTFFDTTLGIPIWALASSGTGWVNSAGSPV